MSSGSKLTLVTSPNYFHASQPSLMFYDVDGHDTKIMMEILLQAGFPLTLCLGYSRSSDRQWLLNTCRQVDKVIVNLEDHDLMKGFVLNYPNVSYYNGPEEFETINPNRFDGPIEFVMGYVYDDCGHL